MSLLLKNLCNFTRPTRIILNNLKGCDLNHICKVSFFWLCNQPTSFTFRMLASLQGRVVFYLVQGEALLIINLNKNMTMFFLYEQYPIFLPAHFWIHNILWPARSYHELASAFVELEDSEYTNVSCSQKSTKLIESAFGMECIYLYDIDITNQKCCFFLTTQQIYINCLPWRSHSTWENLNCGMLSTWRAMTSSSLKQIKYFKHAGRGFLRLFL